MTLGDFFVPKHGGQPLLPILVTNGTNYNNVERIPFMPHIISDLRITTSLSPRECLKFGASYNSGYSLPLKYAIAASSAFPGILPQVKFGFDKPNQRVIRIIDGGVNDNLGYTTLLELLNADSTVLKINKKALIIDCSGSGESIRYGEKTVGIFKLLEHSAFFSVESKYLSFKEDIERQLIADSIPTKNYLKIGITSMRERLDSLSPSDAEFRNTKEYLRKGTLERLSEKQAHKRWVRIFWKFNDRLCRRIRNGEIKIDSVSPSLMSKNANDNGLMEIDIIRNSDLQKLEPTDLLLLYELASLVPTKVKIYRWQKVILTLAGRYVVDSNQSKIKKLYLGEHPVF